MNSPPHDYRRTSHRQRTPGGLLETRVRKDGRRAGLWLNGLLLEVGTPWQIDSRFRKLSESHTDAHHRVV